MTRRALREYATMYVDEVGSLRYRDISSIQPPPYASLARGAGGIIYMLWRRGERRAARRWLSAARADRRRHAYQYGEFDFASSSYMYGRTGLNWLGALLGTDGAVSAYVRAAPRVRDHNFMAGASGYLTGARILLQQRPHPELHRRAAAMAETVLQQVRAEIPWHRLQASGFAFRLPGVLHALLAWHEFANLPVPPDLVTAMSALADAWSLDAVPNGFTTTWCNGATGMTLVWAKAFACTSDERFLDAARRMATLATSITEERSILCCGLAGIAYALLELADLDPTTNWKAQAFDAGVRAVTIVRHTPLQWPNGLYLGHPGVVCLADDLVADQSRGFPAIEERAIRVGT